MRLLPGSSKFANITAAVGATALIVIAVQEYRSWRHVRGLERHTNALTGDVRLLRELDRLRSEDVKALTETIRAHENDVKGLRDQVARAPSRPQCVDDADRLDHLYLSHFEPYDYCARAEFLLDNLTGRTAVIVIIGQSNAANYAAGYYFPRYYKQIANLSIQNGKSYIAQEPLLGSDRDGSSFATRLADKVLAAKLYDHVVLVPIAIGNASAAEWATGGRLNHRIVVAAKRIRAAGLTATHVLWHQGESDAANPHTTPESYTDAVRSVVATFRVHGIEAPFFVAQATHHRNQTPEGVMAVRAGQKALVDPERGIFQGPDTDIIGDEFRDQRSHFTAEGSDRHADLWLAVLRDY